MKSSIAKRKNHFGRAGLMLLLVLMLFRQGAAGQATDTLTMARILIEKRGFHASERLLAAYNARRPGELNAQWLYAQAAYFAGHFRQAFAAYDDAIAWHPENYYLRLDYAKKLVETGHFGKALPILRLYLAYDPDATEVHATLARISFWQGDYRTALASVEKVLARDPSNQPARQLRRDILQTRAPWLGLQATVTADDQPLQRYTPAVEAGISLHRLANVQVRLESPVYRRDNGTFTSQWLSVGNRLVFGSAGLRIDLSGGALRLPNGEYSYTAGITLQQKLFDKLVLTAGAAHEPYLSTRANLDAPLLYRHYAASLAWTDLNGWQGRASYDRNHFYTDHNTVHQAGAWILTPPVRWSHLDFRIGYSYQYSDSDENRFASEKSLAELIANWDSAAAIRGVYNPCFTPSRQQVHSAVLAVGYHPGRRFDAGLRISAGVYATTRNPSLYLDKDASDKIFVARHYAAEQFFPFEAAASAAWQLNAQCSLRADYAFISTFFYQSHFGGLGLTYRFWHE